MQVQRRRQAQAALPGGTDSDPRPDRGVRGVELPTLRDAQQGGLKACGITRPLSAVKSIGLSTKLATVNRAKICGFLPLGTVYFVGAAVVLRRLATSQKKLVWVEPVFSPWRSAVARILSG